MTIEAHLAELERRHRTLENEIAEAFAHRSTGDFKVAELKRQKLQLKEEIERLRSERVGRKGEAYCAGFSNWRII